MTTASLYRVHLPSTTEHYAQGWTISVLFHGLVIAAAMLLLSDLQLAPQPEPFKWDVAMVQQRQAAAPSPTPKPSRESPPAPPQPQPPPQERREIVQRSQPVHRVVHQEVRQVRPIVRETPAPQRTVSDQAPVPVHHETVVIPNQEPVVEPVMHETTVAESTPMTAIKHEPVRPEAPPAPAVEAPGVPDAPIVSKAAPVERQAAIHDVPVQARPATRPDYSWLAEALWSRVERMKRYPYVARMNRWEGKVVLEAVIREDGHVLNLKVAQSSGYAVLDKDAMEVLQKASPLALKHPLGQPQVVVQVPISYRLER